MTELERLSGDSEEDPIARALAGWDAAVQTSTKQSQRNRRTIRWVAVTLVVDAIFTVLLAIGGWQVHQASSTTAEVRQSAYQQCVTSNKDRTIVLGLWKTALTPNPTTAASETPMDKALVAHLLAEAKSAYAQRKC